jgi:hypothetical protein
MRRSETKPDDFIAKDLQEEDHEKKLKGKNRNDHNYGLYSFS